MNIEEKKFILKIVEILEDKYGFLLDLGEDYDSIYCEIIIETKKLLKNNKKNDGE